MGNSCLFCGAKGARSLSNEHVIPQWLLRHLDLPADDMLFQGVASSTTEKLVQPPRIHSSFNFVQGHVCEECNTGWMSRLEGIAKPVLIPLIDNETRIESLSSADADIVGKWVVKTAYMHRWTSPLEHPVRLDNLKALCGDAGRPSPGVAVFGMQADFKQPSAYFLSGHWPQFYMPEMKVSDETPGDAYKIGLQFRYLYLLTAFWPSPKIPSYIGKGTPHSSDSHKPRAMARLFNRYYSWRWSDRSAGCILQMACGLPRWLVASQREAVLASVS